MAPNSKKRLVQIPAPSSSPSSSSSEEQQDSSGSGSGSGSSSSSEEEQQEHPQPVTLKPDQQDEDDSAEDDDEETEESDEPEKPALKSPSLKKPQSESESKEDEESDSDDEAIKSPMVSDFSLKARVPNSAKRATENSGSSSKNKKAKVSNGGDGQIIRSADEAKKSTSRVWSGDDEIKLLEGVIAYKAKNGSDSITNLGPFHETVKDLNLSLDVTRTRLYEKLRALKKKYQNNVAKKGDIVFSKPHELKLYKLSEMMWGGEEGGLNEESGSKVKSPDKKKSNKAANVSVKKSVENKDMVKKSVENKDMVKTDQVSDEIKDDALDVGSLYPRLAASIELEASTYLPVTSVNSKDFAKEMVLKLGKEKAIELEEEWNDYTEMEHRLFAKRLQMIHKHAETFLDVMKH